MPFTSDVSTDIGKVRLLIHDMDSGNPLFPEDNMIQAFLDLEGAVKLAAALALESLAANAALVFKVMRLLDLELDGASVAKALRETAKSLRDSEDADWSGIDFAEVVDNSIFSYREYIGKLIEAQD